jgi:hypothetical protein
MPREPSHHYRLRRVPGRTGFEVRVVDGDRERALTGPNVPDPTEAASSAALAVLGHHLHGDWPRARRLADAFERELLSGGSAERRINSGAIAQWVARRERS